MNNVARGSEAQFETDITIKIDKYNKINGNMKIHFGKKICSQAPN